MIVALVVLEIFYSQASVGLQREKLKKEIIQPWTLRIIPKVNQVIYTLDTICYSNVMILAQAVLDVFVLKLLSGYNEINGQGRQFSHELR